MITATPLAPVYRDAGALSQWLLARVRRTPFHVVGIDGMDRTGKSTLAQALARSLGCEVIDCEGYALAGARDRAPHALDLPRLRRAIMAALDPQHPVIVVGTHLRSVLQAMSLRAATRIYVRHQWPAGRYTHGRVFEHDDAARAMVTVPARERFRGIAPFDDALIAYHRRERPHETADVYFDACFRSDDLGWGAGATDRAAWA